MPPRPGQGLCAQIAGSLMLMRDAAVDCLLAFRAMYNTIPCCRRRPRASGPAEKHSTLIQPWRVCSFPLRVVLSKGFCLLYNVHLVYFVHLVHLRS